MEALGQKSNTTKSEMEPEPIMEPSVSEEKTEKPSRTSGSKKSPKKDSGNTPLPVRLGFLQQIVLDYKNDGGKVEVIDLERDNAVAVILHNVGVEDGKLVIRLA